MVFYAISEVMWHFWLHEEVFGLVACRGRWMRRVTSRSWEMRIWCAQAGMSAAMTCWDALCEEVIIHDKGGFHFTWRSRGIHVHEEKGNDLIGSTAARCAEKLRKRLPTLFGSFQAHPGSELSQVKGHGCPRV